MKSKKAFTIIEVIVVLSIITVFLGLSGAYLFNFRSGTALEQAAHQVSSALQLARTLSITKREQHRVVFDFSGKTYSIYSDSGIAVEADRSLPGGIEVDSLTTGDTVTFNITGGMASGSNNSIFLKNSAGDYYTLTVVSSTGRVRIFEYHT